MRTLAASAVFLICLSALSLASAQPATPDPLSASLAAPWTGDLDGMLERRVIRVLVPYSRTLYFLDGAEQRGMAYEIMRDFETVLNERMVDGHLRIEVAFIPTTRDRLIQGLEEGVGDVIAANLTITPERSERVAFTTPLGRQVSELLIRHVEAQRPTSWDDLGGQNVMVHPDSSYFEHLLKINRERVTQGQPAIGIQEAPGHFETEDILEMVNAGLADYTIADSYLASLWVQVFDRIAVHPELALSEDNSIAFAVRRDSPQLKAALDEFLVTRSKGTLHGNILFDRYYKGLDFVSSATAEAERARFEELAGLFEHKSEQYGLDWLMIMAQSYQESRLDHSVVSPAGAIGIMQLLPATGADMGVEDLTVLEENVLAGVRYVRYLIDNFFDEPSLPPNEQLLFALAAYNAGPGRIRQLRQTAAERGLDRNRWFNNVERIAAEKIGRETVRYVANIYKYYVAYRLVYEQGLLAVENPASTGP
ncbi:MAG: transporter substrate-binding domain-containing protein [Wenzhouxiangella sp.]|nr:transporter substrate-binding domain-containing protein [Wenzhouxiangella sp.]